MQRRTAALPLASVPAAGPADAILSLDLEVTIAADPGGEEFCATGDFAYVTPGTPVRVCYRVTNTGTQALIVHDLVDPEFGTILDGFPFDLVPDTEAFITQTVVANATTVFTGTWTGFASGGASVSDVDSAAVVVPEPAEAAPAVAVALALIPLAQRRRTR